MERGTVVCNNCAGRMVVGCKVLRGWWLGNGIGGGRGGGGADLAENTSACRLLPSMEESPDLFVREITMSQRLSWAAGILLLVSLPEASAQNKEIIDCINSFGVKDFLELNERQGKELARLLPAMKSGFNNHEAKVIFRKSNHVSHDLIVVEISPKLMTPGATLAHVHFFREDGGLIRSQVFNVGYRESLYSIRVIKSPDINDYLIEIQTYGMFGDGQDYKFFTNDAEWRPRYRKHTHHQLYAFQNNEVRLIRLTDEDGMPLSNLICVKHANIGPLCDYSFEQVEQLLKSKSVVDQLCVLTWVNGKHFTEHGGRWEAHQHETKQSIETYTKSRSSPAIKQLIEQLEENSCHWVGELAFCTKRKLY